MRILILIILLFPGIAAAQDDSVIATKIDGKDYVCFIKAKADRLLQKIKNQTDLIAEQEKSIESKKKIITKLEEVNGIQEQQVITLKKDNADLYKRLEESNAWYKSNALWFSVGTVVGAALTVGIVYGVKD